MYIEVVGDTTGSPADCVYRGGGKYGRKSSGPCIWRWWEIRQEVQWTVYIEVVGDTAGSPADRVYRGGGSYGRKSSGQCI